jgi:hypothetical protein
MGGKYHFNIQINSVENNAGSKAIDDCKKILNKNNYKDLEVNFIKTPYLIFYNVLKLFSNLVYFLFTIKKKSIIVVQYPLKGINNYFRFFARLLKYKQCLIACIIHDVDSIRDKKFNIKKEILNLNAYTVVVSHNNRMTAWLTANGLTAKVVELEIFDYLHNNAGYNKLKDFTINDKTVVFAGSLGRGKFIYDLYKIEGEVKFRLYGTFINSEVITAHNNVKWMGTYPPDGLIEELKGEFGLVWDGDSINHCGGRIGEYLQYNNPHKASLYIAAGIPIIIPSNAAIADFVLKNNIGITINSIADIPAKLNRMSDQEYSVMLKNTNAVGEKVRIGYFFNSALKQLEAMQFKVLS